MAAWPLLTAHFDWEFLNNKKMIVNKKSLCKGARVMKNYIKGLLSGIMIRYNVFTDEKSRRAF